MAAAHLRSTATRFLHVANGTCTTKLIEAAGIPGALSIWADPLHDGPVPGGQSHPGAGILDAVSVARRIFDEAARGPGGV